ncbi:MAG TPA: universal stress protein [Lacipirellulaceae bacterium]|nr:universal stress protein [Lacipirellulaceae bacterium]
MNIQSILFPTDFSRYNDAALEYASTLAAEAGATLHIVHVHDVRDLSSAMGEASYLYASTWQEELEAARERLNRISPTVPGVPCERHCLTGTPDEEIVNMAAEKSIDLIVMASHGRTGLSRLVMGSVAEGVMRKAPCPVLIVKQPHEKDVEELPAGTLQTESGSSL